MNIEFKKITFDNFLSYKENNTYVFDKGLDLLSGKNGRGKSGIIDSIFYSLFGKPYRKIKLNSLINRYKKKKLKTEIEFVVDNTYYKVIRGMKPNIFEIYRNNELIQQSANIKDYQKMLENDILNFNESIFRQLIVLGANIDSTKPFMDLSQNEKEIIFQTLTDTSIFNEVTNKLKEKISLVKTELKDLEYKKELLENSIKTEENVIKQAEQRNKDFKENNKNNLLQINEDIETTKSKINKYQEALDKLIKLKDDYKKLKETLDNYNKDLNTHKQKLNEINNKIQYIENAEENSIECINCKTINYLVPIEDDKNILEKEKSDILLYIEEINKKIKPLNDRVNKLYEALLNSKSIKNTLDNLNKNIEYLYNRKEELNNFKEIKIDYTNLNKTKEKNIFVKENLSIIKDNLKDLTELLSIMSNQDLKGAVIKQQIPHLNRNINYFMEKFSMLSYSFILNESFKEQIITNSEDTEFNQLSNGQKTRISFSIMFAFLKLIETRNTIKTNLLVLDEVLDTSLDTTGKEELLYILKNEFNNKNVIIISHNPEIKEKTELFDRLYEVVNDKEDTKYSKLELLTSLNT